MSLTRIFAVVLAISGIWLIPAARIPLFWPGLLIWVCWVAIGLGACWLNHPLFWLCCASWDGYWMLALFGDTEWSRYNNVPGYWHVLAHATVSVALSIAAIVVLIFQYRSDERAQKQQSRQEPK